MSITIAFNDHPNEGNLIGDMVVGYGEIEFDWALCLGVTLQDTNTAIATMYRLKSEANRVKIGDSLMRGDYVKNGLESAYLDGFNTISWCKKIRNQYAHSQWLANKDGLFFTDFETAADKPTNDFKLSFSKVEMPLLVQQSKYFLYCMELLLYLRSELGLRKGIRKDNEYKKPKVLPVPPLYSLQKKYPPRPPVTEGGTPP